MTEFLRYNKLYNSLIKDNKLIHVGLLLKEAYLKYKDNCALICDDEKIDYKELYFQANLFAKKLLEFNVKKNDKVVILYHNSIDFYIAYYASWLISAVVVPLNIFLLEKDIIDIIENCNPEIMVISQYFLDKFENLSKLNIKIISQVRDISKENIEIDIIERSIKDTAVILYTSGTTGTAKGVMLSSENIIINAIQGLSRFESSIKDKIYCPLPLFHSLPQNICIWSPVIIGATAITNSRLDRTKIRNSLSNNPTVIVAVPALYGLFCKLKDLKFDSVRFFISGGDILSDKIRKYFELIYRRKLCNGYGLTETAPFIAVDTDNYTQDTNTIGRPFWGISCQIRDENLNALDINKVGVLWVNGKNIMTGYYNNKKSTEEVIQDCWFNTGDLAYINKDNKIVISGREKDLIKSKGIKIFPHEIENLLLTHDKVTQAAVIGKDFGDEQYPVAFIESNEKDIERLKKELIELSRNSLAPYKIPKEFIIKKELKVGPTGKVDKKNLKEIVKTE